MARHDLPNEQWVDLLDPADITRREIRRVRIAYGRGETVAERLELGREEILVIIIKNWTLDKPVPSTEKDPLTILDSLDRATWYVLEEIAAEYMVHFGDPANETPAEKPVDPPLPSTD